MDYTPTQHYKHNTINTRRFFQALCNNNSKQIAASFPPPEPHGKKTQRAPRLPDSPCSIGAHPSIFPAPTKRWIHHNNQLKQLTTHHFGQNGSKKNVFQRNQGSKWILQSATARTKRLAKAWRSSRRRWPCKLAFNGLPLGRLRWGDSSGADQSYPHFWGEKWCKYDEICQI